MTLDEWASRARHFTYRGHRIAYWDEGAGEALLCLHGFPTASWDWHRLWPDLMRRFRVVAADFIGFGFSAKPLGYPFSLFDQADLVERMLQHLGLDACHILAHDYGDTVTQELMARRLDARQATFAIRSACLLNGGLFPEAIHPRSIQKLLAGPLGGIAARMVSETRFKKNISAVFGPETKPSEDELRDFWRLVRHNDGLRVAHRISRYQGERRRNRDRWVGALKRTAVPLRFVCGQADPVSGEAMAARFRELVPTPDVTLLDGIGHYPQVEAPARVLATLLQFITRQPV